MFKTLSRVKHNNGKIVYKASLVQFFQDKDLNQAKKT